MVVELDPVADHAAGVLLAFEPMAMRTLLLQGADDPLDHPVLLRAVRRDERKRPLKPPSLRASEALP